MGFKVGDEYRTNELSLTPGGSEVKSISTTGKSKTYDKVKNVNAYCQRLIKDQKIAEIWVDSTLYWKRN